MSWSGGAGLAWPGHGSHTGALHRVVCVYCGPWRAHPCRASTLRPLASAHARRLRPCFYPALHLQVNVPKTKKVGGQDRVPARMGGCVAAEGPLGRALGAQQGRAK